MLERSIDDCWNIEGDRDLSDAWTGFTRFTLLDERPPEGCSWTKKQTTSRPDHLWPETWKIMSDTEHQKWAVEKPKLDNARKLRGTYFVDPTDAEFKETIFFKRGKVGSSDASSHACKIRRSKHGGNL